MIKKEVLELRRLFKPETTNIDYVVTAFVKHNDGGVDIEAINKRRLLTLEDEEFFKHLDIAKRTLSGTIEKNLLNIDFPLDECGEGKSQDRLYKLLTSDFSDDDQLREFIEFVATNYDAAEHLMIQLVKGSYDVPIKTKDNMQLDDSDTVYTYMIGSICPMTLEKAGLYFNTDNNGFQALEQKLVVDKPEAGFLFPAFNDRASDIHQLLFYTKKADDIHAELISALTGGKLPVPADLQEKLFEDIVSQTIESNTMSFDDAKTIHGEIRARIDTRRMNEEDTHITKSDIKDIITSAIGEVDDAHFDKAYDNIMDGYEDNALALENIIETEKFNIDAANMQIKIKPDETSNIEQKVIDGRQCFVIPVSENVAVNGIPVTVR